MRRIPTTIYIIDDDVSAASSLARLMRSVGFCPAVFHSIDDFLSGGTLDRGACILADVRMPGGDGTVLPRRLREIGFSIPVILLTAQDTDETRAQAKLEGCSGFFRKPVDDQALIDAIEWALDPPGNTKRNHQTSVLRRQAE